MISINPDNLSQKLVQLSATIAELNKLDISENSKKALSDNIAVAFVNSHTEYIPDVGKRPLNLGYLIVRKDNHSFIHEKTIYTMSMDARVRLGKMFDQDQYEVIMVTEMKPAHV